MNLIDGEVQQDGVHLGDYTVPVPRDTLAKASDEKNLVLGIRPENFELNDDPESNEGIPIDVGVVEELGADAFIYGTLSGIAEDELITAQQIVGRIHGRTPPNRGETVRLQIDPTHVHVFSTTSGLRISPELHSTSAA
jgi:multiple sugar transport system ATP-binding protein